MKQLLTVYTHEIYFFDDGSRVTVSQDRVNQGRCILHGVSSEGNELFYTAQEGNMYEYNPLPLIRIEMHKRGVSENLDRRQKLIEYHLEPAVMFGNMTFNITPGDNDEGINVLFNIGTQKTHMKSAHAFVDYDDFLAVRAYTDAVFRFYTGFGKG